MDSDNLTPAERFVERLGIATEEEGLPRISGRLLALMLLEEEPLSFDELADRLQVSRSSVSTNTRILENRGIIERTGRPGDRRTYYRVADDPYEGMISTLIRRKRKVKEIIQETLRELEGPDERSRVRLERMLRFYELTVSALESMMAEWQDAPTPEAT